MLTLYHRLILCTTSSKGSYLNVSLPSNQENFSVLLMDMILPESERELYVHDSSGFKIPMLFMMLPVFLNTSTRPFSSVTSVICSSEYAMILNVVPNTFT